MASFYQDYDCEDNDRFFDEVADIFNLTFHEAGNAFSGKELTASFKDFPPLGHCRSINGLLVFTLREFPGLVVDILSTDNYIVELARAVIYSHSLTQRKPARA
jgi:hypothetical protein